MPRRIRRSFVHTPGRDPQADHWEGYDWSRWYDFPDVVEAYAAPRLIKEASDLEAFTAGPAIYRFRARGRKALLYIGETGRSARSRLRSYWRGVQRFEDGRKGRFRILTRRLSEELQAGARIQVSWMPVDRRIEKPDSLGIEAELIAAHRQALGRNPAWQFLSMLSEEAEL